MEPSLLFVRFIQLRFHRGPAHSVERNRAFPLILKCPLLLQHQFVHQVFTALYHDQEIIVVTVHKPDIPLAEISPVQYEPRALVPIGCRLLKQVLKLRDIVDTARIILIEKRNLVVPVIGNREVIDWFLPPFLLMPEFCKFYLPGLTVFVRGIAGNIDLLPMVS